jgi:carboxyl-terminal processing protease
MDDGDALRLTTALYYTKSGRSIQAQGITPDISVSDKRFPKDSEELLEDDESEEELQMKERDLPGALKNPAATQAKDKQKEAEEERLRVGSRSAMQADLSKLLKDDPQLDEALRLLKTWNVFQGKPTIQASEKPDANIS